MCKLAPADAAALPPLPDGHELRAGMRGPRAYGDMSRAVPAPLRCRRPSCISLMQSLRMARRCAADVADAAGAACGVGAWSPRRFAPPVSGGLAQPGPAAAWRARVPRAGCGQPAQQKYGAQRFPCSTLTSKGKIDSQMIWSHIMRGNGENCFHSQFCM